jgi:glycosyltransferase involved in cell wall biosynthesis
MNILVANWTWFPSGGDWTYVENLTELYQANGHKVIPFAMHDDRNFETPYQKYFVSNINYKSLNAKKSLSGGLKVLSKSIYSNEAKTYLNKLLDEVDIQLAHLNLIHHYITPSILEVLKKRNIPIIWTLHDYTPICPEGTFISNDNVCEACKGGKFYNTVLNKCKKNSFLASSLAAMENYIHHFKEYYNNVDYFICPSIFSYQKYKEFNFFNNKLRQLYHGYNYVEPNEDLILNEISDEKFILFVGRLEKIKGTHTLLKAMQKNPKIRLKIIGDGTEDANLRAFASKNELINVEFLGKKDKHDVLKLIKKSAFLICPSECYEVLGFTIVEAMLIGKPVIGANIGAIPETVIDGITGHLFEPKNDSELAEKISLLYHNEALINKLGSNAKIHASKLFNPQKHFEGLKAIIPEL